MRLTVVMLVLSFAVLASAQAPRARIRYLNPDTLAKPAGYSHVVETGGGRTVYIAGQVSRDRSGTLVGKGDFRAQARQVFDNLSAALAAVGATPKDIVKMTSYVTTMDLQAYREVRAEKLGDHAPASTLVQITALADPAFLIEIEAVAVIPE
jgi:enamine deaminase RidA (YjgF/YER057c/UK114 family)